MLNNLRNDVAYVSNDQEYFKEREERFRQTSDSTYQRIWWIGFFQFIICVGIGLWQMWSMRNYLKAKKFV